MASRVATVSSMLARCDACGSYIVLPIAATDTICGGDDDDHQVQLLLAARLYGCFKAW